MILGEYILITLHSHLGIPLILNFEDLNLYFYYYFWLNSAFDYNFQL